MSGAPKLSRRALFGLDGSGHRAESAPARGSTASAFSLDDFYRGRAARGERTGDAIPAFARLVRVRQSACLAWQRSFCSVCLERCPVPGAIVVELGRPRVVEAACTGCGVCVRVCPAPTQALELLPRRPGDR